MRSYRSGFCLHAATAHRCVQHKLFLKNEMHTAQKRVQSECDVPLQTTECHGSQVLLKSSFVDRPLLFPSAGLRSVAAWAGSGIDLLSSKLGQIESAWHSSITKARRLSLARPGVAARLHRAKADLHARVRHIDIMSPPYQGSPFTGSESSTGLGAPSEHQLPSWAITDADFEQCASLLEGDEPSSAMWELVSDKPNAGGGGVRSKVYRKRALESSKGSTATTYLSQAVFDESLDLVFAALSDLSRRREWDKYCLDLRQVATLGDSKLVYWKTKYPFPLAARDYVYVVRSMHGPGADTRLVVSRSVPVDCAEEFVPTQQVPPPSLSDSLSVFGRICMYAQVLGTLLP